ncbi:MAG: glucans biosynthesis glucosyltransferase MdoH [Gemmobacter sp.]
MTFALHLAPGDDVAVPAALPLAMPDQDLGRAFRDRAAPGVGVRREVIVARIVALGLPALLSLLIAVQSLVWFGRDGQVLVLEGLLAIGTGVACYWMGVSVATSALGLFRRPTAAPRPTGRKAGLRVAILLPMYGEDAQATIAPAVALLAALPGRDHGHRFSLHVLSDTRDAVARADERAVLADLAMRHPRLSLHLRQRRENRDFKSGNIRDWIMCEGGAHDAALVLDADSVMGRSAVLRLCNALAAEPGVALVQSLPLVLPGNTLWQRMQCFAARVYGANLGRGVAVWAGTEGNFLGHNAILRLRAFAACAGLPHLPGPRPLGGVILSHDFVEAALLRRAGWGVRMLPEAADSFEGTPDALPGHLRRDRRWCQGNMQHLRLLAMPGLHWVSRFHLLQGAAAYLSSVWWLGLLALWVALAETDAGRAATVTGPLMGRFAVTLVVTALLMGPKLVGLAAYLRDRPPARGRRAAFAATALAEVGLSVLLAPAMMLHQVRAVVTTLCGIDGGWAPHLAVRPTLGRLARFHAVETGAGALLLGLVAAGVLTPWALPVALCLALTVPVSWLVAQDVTGWRLFAPCEPR